MSYNLSIFGNSFSRRSFFLNTSERAKNKPRAKALHSGSSRNIFPGLHKHVGPLGSKPSEIIRRYVGLIECLELTKQFTDLLECVREHNSPPNNPLPRSKCLKVLGNSSRVMNKESWTFADLANFVNPEIYTIEYKGRRSSPKQKFSEFLSSNEAWVDRINAQQSKENRFIATVKSEKLFRILYRSLILNAKASEESKQPSVSLLDIHNILTRNSVKLEQIEELLTSETVLSALDAVPFEKTFNESFQLLRIALEDRFLQDVPELRTLPKPRLISKLMQSYIKNQKSEAFYLSNLAELFQSDDQLQKSVELIRSEDIQSVFEQSSLGSDLRSQFEYYAVNIQRTQFIRKQIVDELKQHFSIEDADIYRINDLLTVVDKIVFGNEGNKNQLQQAIYLMKPIASAEIKDFVDQLFF